MTMTDTEQINGGEQQAPEAPVQRFRFDESFFDGTDEPEATESTAAVPASTPETPAAAEKAPESARPAPSTSSDEAPVYDPTLRAPELRKHLLTRDEELRAERARTSDLTAKIADLEKGTADHSQKLHEAYAKLGIDAGWNDVKRRVAGLEANNLDPQVYLDADEWELYQKHLPYQEAGEQLLELASRGIRASDLEAAQTRIEKHGLNPKTISEAIAYAVRDGGNIGPLLDHVAESVQARADEKIKDLQAEIGARDQQITKLQNGSRRDPGSGGRSASAERSTDRNGSEYDPSRRNAGEQIREWLTEKDGS